MSTPSYWRQLVLVSCVWVWHSSVAARWPTRPLDALASFDADAP